MILQNFIFPNKNICKETELYYRVLHGTVTLQNDQLIMETEAKVNFFTYFNAFSATKWLNHTILDEIHLSLHYQGKGTISLCMAVKQEEQLVKKILQTYSVNTSMAAELSLSFGTAKVPEDAVYYIEAEATEHLEIYNGYYHSGQVQPINQINIAIGICTYRREDFVRKTLHTISESFLAKKDSALYNHIQVFVSDNGNTLPLSELNTDKIHVFYNRNVGGAGGFGRCMLEAINTTDQYHFTHILLMDDDIKLEPEALLRTYTFLSMLQSQYQSYPLAGGLLRMDIPYIQHANGELWQKGRIGSPKAGYDLRQEYMIIKNEENLPIDYSGWWYCCIPVNTTAEFSFPLPIFIHEDDIEYGLRYHRKPLTLNGISVWHDAFDNRRASSMQYYDTRNTLICNAIHYPELRTATVVWTISRHLLHLLLLYRYEDQNLVIRAIEDFCKGVDFLKTTDTVTLHQTISKMGYTQYDISKDLEQIDVQKYYTPAKPEELYLPKSFSLFQKLTLNGWLLPGKKDCKPVPFGAHPSELYRCKKALLFDPDNNKGFPVERQHRQLWISLGRCLKIWKLLRKNYRKVVRDYQIHATDLTSKEFWEQYLDTKKS